MNTKNDERPFYTYMGKPVSQETVNWLADRRRLDRLNPHDVAKLVGAPKVPTFLGYGDDDGDD